MRCASRARATRLVGRALPTKREEEPIPPEEGTLTFAAVDEAAATEETAAITHRNQGRVAVGWNDDDDHDWIRGLMMRRGEEDRRQCV